MCLKIALNMVWKRDIAFLDGRWWEEGAEL